MSSADINRLHDRFDGIEKRLRRVETIMAVALALLGGTTIGNLFNAIF